MTALKIPKLSAARAPKRVAMPKFRRNVKAATSLTEAIHRVLSRTHTNAQPFGVFAISGRLVISNANTDRFKALQRRAPEAFIGMYGPGLRIADALEDLCEHFTDEVADGT
ncbi:hypothetical protein [Noviherbaspirillum autotrophicum]|uniref:Uncharacterized protein n=1 Tax=Noviherbaspirillum autotrophicum TaxID=709839 RepID=A0A0C2BLF2_9BURK|nr:hypothetical protein [Noviherbaspirillum autotrophicum]KIF80787.1 hypothetical protein TSA66_08075 [Noviherbaspirillum autotrophicum]KIF80824.1 hypothetical protein TSA66_08320 [Noviherbaspirillum autotrophicum]KIF84049.1 hypothetical protein TSA66_01010 [Noviherbaspirillum autotrophicum]